MDCFFMYYLRLEWKNNFEKMKDWSCILSFKTAKMNKMLIRCKEKIKDNFKLLTRTAYCDTICVCISGAVCPATCRVAVFFGVFVRNKKGITPKYYGGHWNVQKF